MHSLSCKRSKLQISAATIMLSLLAMTFIIDVQSYRFRTTVRRTWSGNEIRVTLLVIYSESQ